MAQADDVSVTYLNKVGPWYSLQVEGDDDSSTYMMKATDSSGVNPYTGTFTWGDGSVSDIENFPFQTPPNPVPTRMSKPDEADKTTINTKSMIDPDNDLVSDDAKDTMVSNYQAADAENKNSQPSDDSIINQVPPTQFEDDENHQEYKIDGQQIDSTSTTGSNVVSSDSDPDQSQNNTATLPTPAIYSPDDDNTPVMDIKYSDVYGKYGVVNPNLQNNSQGNSLGVYAASDSYSTAGFSPIPGLLSIISYTHNYPRPDDTIKTQIVLHHTVSPPNQGSQIIDDWNSKGNGVATHFVIKNDGTVYQTQELNFWSYHLGLKDSRNIKLNRQSIGIELANWGGLIYKNGIITNAYGNTVPNQNIVFMNFRGYNAFQRYTDDQINALRMLILQLSSQYNIPLTYNSDMWDYSENAMNGNPGIWTHVSFRKDKSDCFPQDTLIGMIQGLSNG